VLECAAGRCGGSAGDGDGVGLCIESKCVGWADTVSAARGEHQGKADDYYREEDCGGVAFAEAKDNAGDGI